MSHLFYDFMFQQHNMNKEGRNVSIIRERERERERRGGGEYTRIEDSLNSLNKCLQKSKGDLHLQVAYERIECIS